jgi:hypothetical protein
MLRNCSYDQRSERLLWLSGCVEEICNRLLERRTGEEQKDRANVPGLVRLADLYGTEEELNKDFLRGYEPGTTARRRREQEARDAEYERQEEEASKREEELIAKGTDSHDAYYLARNLAVPTRQPGHVQRGSYRRSSSRSYGYSQAEMREYERRNSAAFKAGRAKGRELGLGGNVGSGKALSA